MDLSAQVVKKITRELHELEEKPEEGIKVLINEQNLTDIQAEIDGPAGTPYDGGLFRMRLVLSNDFPNSPPKGFFSTKIFHPNVSTSGEICVNVLKKDWTAETSLRHVLQVIRCLLIQPFPDSALNEEAGKLLNDNYEDFAKHARLMTSLHAPKPKQQPTPLTTSGANASSDGKKDGAGTSAEPALKKPKAEQAVAAAAAKQKKSLKRL